ncbi:MAG TPA: flagellar hook-associated protein FlgK, partial [Terriglobales bacterium]|nr:flagellar hook-associated protein FlgK [Terriglobales bacterium]
RQQQGAANAFVQSMSQAQVMFSDSSGDIGSTMAAFFSSLQSLSTDPASMSLRQGVLAAAGNLASAFRTTSQNLNAQRSNLDLSVGETVDQINVLSSQIANLNAQITTMQNMHQEPSAFIDQRDVLIGKLADLVDVSTIQSDKGLSLTTSNGTALVAGDQSFKLDVQLDVSGVQHIFSQGNDLTASIKGGALAGYLQVRDQKIPSIQSSLDVLAAGIANAVNAANRKGFDLSGNPGGDFFVAPPSSGQGAAATLSLQITDPALIAASSDGSPGSNGNVAQLLAVHDQAIAGGKTPSEHYANLVFGIGSDVANGTAEQDATGLVLGQLQDQRGSVSGVSLDEEAANLLQYQRAYDAAAKVVTTINDMLEAAVNLGRY